MQGHGATFRFERLSSLFRRELANAGIKSDSAAAGAVRIFTIGSITHWQYVVSQIAERRQGAHPLFCLTQVVWWP
jgi:hypothetical protein